MAPSIRVASHSEMDVIATIMDRGFEDDPTVNWVLTREDFSTSHRSFVEACARPAFDAGGVHVFTDFSGAAIWYPPGVGPDESELARVFERFERQDRTASFFALLDACAEFRPDNSYWELELLAVDPEQRGLGRGAKLLEYGLQNCDGGRALIYLESSNPANLPFYRRHGFELLAEVQLAGTPKRYPMLRAGGLDTAVSLPNPDGTRPSRISAGTPFAEGPFPSRLRAAEATHPAWGWRLLWSHPDLWDTRAAPWRQRPARRGVPRSQSADAAAPCRAGRPGANARKGGAEF